MNRFPFFKPIEGDALIIGGGRVALRKASVLAAYAAKIRVVAPEIGEDFAALDVLCFRRAFEESDLDGAGLVVAASDDHKLNARVAELCAGRGIEVNVVDSAALSTFHFPAILRRGDLTVAVSSGGTSPLAAKYIREKIEEIIPDNFDEILVRMEFARRRAMEQMDSQPRRSEALSKIFARCIENRPLLDEAEIEEILAGALENR